MVERGTPHSSTISALVFADLVQGDQVRLLSDAEIGDLPRSRPLAWLTGSRDGKDLGWDPLGLGSLHALAGPHPGQIRFEFVAGLARRPASPSVRRA